MAKKYSLCPSCRHKLSPLTTECPVCGIPLSREPLKRPLLFQISKASEKFLQKPQKSVATDKPAQIPIPDSNIGPTKSNEENNIPLVGQKESSTTTKVNQLFKMGTQSTFWRLARMEFLEAIFLLILNILIALVVCWQLKLTPSAAYFDFWSFLLPLHFLVSWAFIMFPILISGSSVAMLIVGFGIADSQPEKRLSFSLFMLLSVALVPLSFLCMVLTPAHTTMAELMTGQEIRERIPELMRWG